jgi:branched-chain amino acid transport system substrate-binding protein
MWIVRSLPALAAGRNMEVVGSAFFQQGDDDFHAQIAEIKKANPDAVYLYGFNQLGLVAKQLRELGVTARIIGGVDMELPEVLAVGRNAVEGAIYARSEYDPSRGGSIARNFAAAYQRQTGKRPDVYAAVHYDAVRILAAAFRAAGPSRAGVREYIEGLDAFDGASGVTTFGRSHDATKPVGVRAIRGGQYVALEPP